MYNQHTTVCDAVCALRQETGAEYRDKMLALADLLEMQQPEFDGNRGIQASNTSNIHVKYVHMLKRGNVILYRQATDP